MPFLFTYGMKKFFHDTDLTVASADQIIFAKTQGYLVTYILMNKAFTCTELDRWMFVLMKQSIGSERKAAARFGKKFPFNRI